MAMIDRETERRAIRAFFEGAGPGPRALVIEGEAGIGKTTLWHAAVEEALHRGYRRISTRPTEADAQLPLAALNDLIGSIPELDAAVLPAPQQAAVDVALMRTDATEAPTQPLALSLGVVELLRHASSDDPLLLAIDDVQWLDDSTAAVLRFALRRLEGERIVAVVTHRTSDRSAPVTPVLADLDVDRVVRLSVRGMERGAVEALLDDSLGLRLPPSLLGRVHASSAGNPFHALEIGRALRERGALAATDSLPVPPSLGELVRERLEGLPADARDVVALAAAASQPSRELIERVIGPEAAHAGLTAARGARVLETDGAAVRFTHPLLAEEAYGAVGEAGRRDLHRRLAAVVSEPEELARHLALAADGPDDGVAAALDDAATRAFRRGAPDAAADLAERAVGLTPPDAAERLTRIAAAGRFRVVAGDPARARLLLEQALDEPSVATGTARAVLLLELAIVRELTDDFAAAAALGREALRVSGDDRALRNRIKLLLAGTSHITGEDWSGGARHAADAMRLAEGLDDPRILAATIGHYASWRYATGHGRDRDLEQRAAELEPWSTHLRTLDRPEYDFAGIAFQEGDTAGAAARMRSLLTRAETDGDYSSLPFLLGNVAFSDWLDGDARAAADRLDRADRLSEVTGQGAARVHNLVYRARIAARRGEAEEATAAASRALAAMSSTNWRIGEWALRADLALLELSRGDPAAALGLVAGTTDPSLHDASGRRHWAQGVAIEALVALGRVADAQALLANLERHVGRRGAARRLRADAIRARARVAAATGDIVAATEAIEQAETLHRPMEDRWELARTLLLAGEIHRRGRRRARAREALSESLAAFERLGAAGWAAQAREQLGRIGAGREADGLTPTQREVATLVVQGLTNRQVGDRLFMSAHTVEAHLSAVYRTLGIRSRAALEGALAREADPARDSTPGTRDTRPILALGI
jgi:ATP/maltotriose-dependent transcriptional regulator MalT